MDSETTAMIETLSLGKSDYSTDNIEMYKNTISKLEEKIIILKGENCVLRKNEKTIKNLNKKICHLSEQNVSLKDNVRSLEKRLRKVKNVTNTLCSFLTS